jgi:hypothetical protein
MGAPPGPDASEMTTKRLERPRDPIELAKLMGDIATRACSN